MERVMPGYVDHTGTTNQHGIFVERIVCRWPLRWRVRCSRCQSNWDADHRQIAYLTCKNTNCGRAPSERRSSLAVTGDVVTAVRSRDSESTRQFQREQIEKSVRWAVQPSVEAMLSADPSSVRAYMDYLENHN